LDSSQTFEFRETSLLIKVGITFSALHFFRFSENGSDSRSSDARSSERTFIESPNGLYERAWVCDCECRDERDEKQER
jgi:hypothetical protein